MYYYVCMWSIKAQTLSLSCCGLSDIYTSFFSNTTLLSKRANEQKLNYTTTSSIIIKKWEKYLIIIFIIMSNQGLFSYHQLYHDNEFAFVWWTVLSIKKYAYYYYMYASTCTYLYCIDRRYIPYTEIIRA